MQCCFTFASGGLYDLHAASYYKWDLVHASSLSARRCACRLVEFRVMDEAGTLQPLELLGIGDTTLFVSGERQWWTEHTRLDNSLPFLA